MISLDTNVAFLLVIGFMLFLIFLGVPIAFSMGLTAVLGLIFLTSQALAGEAFSLTLRSATLNFVLVAIPLFMLMAQVIIESGVSRKLFDGVEQLFGKVRGGLALSTIVACTIFAACTGSSIANCATIGPVSIAQMIERGYSKKLATGIVAASGGLAVLIPPSVGFILFGFIAQCSVAELFIAGIIPGLIISTGLIFTTILQLKMNPSIAPIRVSDVSINERLLSLAKVWPFLLIALIVLGSIYGGIATVTESAAMGVAVAIFISSVVYRKLSWKSLYSSILTTARSTAFIMIIIVTSLLLGFLLSYLQIPQSFSQFAAGLPSPMIVFICINILLLILGCFLDGTAIMLVVVPIVIPPLVAAGYDLNWIGVVIVLNTEIGLITPPIGMNLFVVQGCSKKWGVSLGDVIRGSAPYLSVHMAALVLLLIFPELTTWLPRLMMG